MAGQEMIAGFAGPRTSYRFELANCVADIDRTLWESVCQAAPDPFMEFPYLVANEKAFNDGTQFWYATLFDDNNEPIGCACFTRYLVDIVMLTPPILQWVNKQIRRVIPSFLRVPVLLGGSPVSTCRAQLVLKDGIDTDRATKALDEIVAEIVREAPVAYITFKEFEPGLAERMSNLTQHGYTRAHSLVTYDLRGELGSWDAYYSSRRKAIRYRIRKHFQKLDEAGLTCVHCLGGEGAAERFTDEVHTLYLNVLNKAEKKLERLPADYFRELARQYPESSRFTFVYKDERPVGFCCGLDRDGQHTLLFCGLDYKLNAEADLYFNLIFRGLKFGLIPGVKQVSIGAAADQFKQHIGCEPTPLSIYLKGSGWIRNLVVRSFSWLLFPPAPKFVRHLEQRSAEPQARPLERAA